MTLTKPYEATFQVGDGETKDFPFFFDEVSENFIRVIIKRADGSIYYPTFSVDMELLRVVFGEDEITPTADDVICIYRDTPAIQDTQFNTLQGYNAKALENILSKIVAMIQEMKANGFSTQILQGEPWSLDLIKPADDGASVQIDYQARVLKKGLYFKMSDGNLLASADGVNFVQMPKSENVAEFRQYTDDKGNVHFEYRVGDKWFGLATSADIADTYTKTEVDNKFVVANAQIDANADAIQKTREDFISADSDIHQILNNHASELTTLRGNQASLGDQVAGIEEKIPESASGTNHLITKQQLLDEEMDIRDDLNEMASELQTQITVQAAAIATLDAEKLDKNQGDINAGKYLIVGNNGNIELTTSGGGGGGLGSVAHDETLTGAGTDNSPLGLSEAIKDEISNKLDKEYASDFRGEWPNYASVPSDSNAYPADTLGSYIPNFNDYIIVKDSSDYFVTSSKNLLDADVVGAVINSTPTAKFIVNYDVWYLGVAYNGYMGSNVPLNTFHSGVGTISFISNSSDSYGVCRFVRLKPNTTYTISAKNGGRCAISSLTDEGGGYSKFSTHIQTPTSLPITFTTNDNSTYGIVLYANSPGTECVFEEIQLEIGRVATSYEVSGGYYLEGTWRFKYAGTWGTNNKAGWTPEYRLDISNINNESIQTKDLTVSTDEGTINIGIVAGTATIATNNGLDIVAQTKFDTAPTTDDNTTYANALDTSLVRKAQVATAIADAVANVDALPDQAGNAGKVLTTDGTTASWQEPAGGTKVIFREWE